MTVGNDVTRALHPATYIDGDDGNNLMGRMADYIVYEISHRSVIKSWIRGDERITDQMAHME